LRPNSAQATITYYLKDGGVVREQDRVGVRQRCERLEINSTTVLSNVTL
jgi:hypothetical protein